MGARHTTAKVHSLTNTKIINKKNNRGVQSSPQKSEEVSELDLSGQTLPDADLYVTNLSISPSLVVFFTNFHRKRQTALQNSSNSMICHPSRRQSFLNQLSMINDIDQNTAELWMNAYVDYMILMAWLYFAVEEKEMYAPFAIQQVQRLHISYPADYTAFCNLLTEGKGIIHFSPRKAVIENETVDFLELLYDELRESIMIYIYENSQIYSSASHSAEQLKDIWEPFYETFVKNEYSFNLSGSNTKQNIQKAISNITTYNHNFSLAAEGITLFRHSLGLSLEYSGDKQLDILPVLVSQEPITEEEKEIARIVDEIKFPLSFARLLSWEQVISIEEAREWIFEYKKYIFLCSVQKSFISIPNERIKRVCILHMSFTRHYEKFFINHMTKNNLEMFVEVYKLARITVADDDGDSFISSSKRYFGEATPNILNRDEESGFFCVYKDIIKKQEELLSLKLIEALSQN